MILAWYLAVDGYYLKAGRPYLHDQPAFKQYTPITCFTDRKNGAVSVSSPSQLRLRS